MITADQLVVHCVGDYLLQSDWMAQEKTKQHTAAFVHAGVYTLGFLVLTRSPLALAVIFGTHFVIDRWRLARYVVWTKNFLAPQWIDWRRIESGVEVSDPVRNLPWSVCQATGYPPDRPAWLAVWLLIIADNLAHVLINALALRYL